MVAADWEPNLDWRVLGFATVDREGFADRPGGPEARRTNEAMTNTDRKPSGGPFGSANDQRQCGNDEEPQAALNVEAQDAINRHLRQVYGDLLSAPIPDKFKALLSELASEGKKK